MPLATLVLMSNSLFALAITGVLYLIGAPGFGMRSALGGLLLGQLVGTVLASRWLSGLGWSSFGRVRTGGTRLLRGQPVVVPDGRRAADRDAGRRVLLAHLSTPLQLSEYALMAQIYGVLGGVHDGRVCALGPFSSSAATLLGPPCGFGDR